MIVGGYSLELYCDNILSKVNKHEYGEFPHQFYGNDRAEAFKEARRHGWRINAKKGTAYCPKCKGETK